MIRGPAKSIALLTLLSACATTPPETTTQCPAQACPVCPVCPPAKPTPPVAKANVFEPAVFSDLPAWSQEDFANTLETLRAACTRFKTRPAWQAACSAIPTAGADAAVLRHYLERYFTPWRIATPEGETSGLVTGYYEPLLRGSRRREGRYQVPLFGPPDDLLVIDLAAVNPDVRNMRLRGRIEGRRVVPYFSRAEIERGAARLAGKEIVWVDDAVEAFFLQIQGSGRVQLAGGELLRVGYADQNGHPYVSIGRVLIDRGELQPGEATMQGIQTWARAHPQRLEDILNQNPSYVFFRELPGGDPAAGPPGAMGVPLTPMRSVAVDPRFVPLGAPLYLATTWPNRDLPLERLVFAQDTGGAIRGAVRADFFWGFGAEAGEQAGRMRQQGRLWLLWPSGEAPRRPQ
jgi:membrane-bound lytic murein transglycosylase A